MYKEKVLLILFLTLAACAGAEQPVLDTSIGSQTDSVDSDPMKMERVYLKAASAEKIEPYRVDHRGKEKVVICHVPPGNPAKYKTLMISENGLKGHFHPENELFKGEDYLGPCGTPELREGIIMLDDPVLEGDGPVCQNLAGDELYACLAEYDQQITIQL